MRIVIAYIFLSLAACGQVKNNSKKNNIDSVDGSTKIMLPQKKIRSIQGYSPSLDKAHPNAKILMAEPFYFNMVDETAPFGNDDAADSYAGFKDWRPTHKNRNPNEFLFEQIEYMGYPKFDIHETDISKLKPYLQERELGSRFMSGIDAAIVAIAFGQLYLEGTIDKELKEIAKTAIMRQLNPELLALWGDPYKEERKIKLKKMLAVLYK
jgi:uncharacterized protein YfeS